MSVIIIADIGNNHFGSVSRAREMIRTAIGAGADIIKGQAFDPLHMKGSMPSEFYHRCYLPERDLLDLVEYARSLGRNMFFSIIAEGFCWLRAKQTYQKLTASQSAEEYRNPIISGDHLFDRKNYFISINDGLMSGRVPAVKHATLLAASDYLGTVPYQYLLKLKETVDKFGYSDHTVGVESAINVGRILKPSAIEVHFCIEHGVKVCGKIFRDTVFGKTPDQLYEISRGLK